MNIFINPNYLFQENCIMVLHIIILYYLKIINAMISLLNSNIPYII